MLTDCEEGHLRTVLTKTFWFSGCHFLCTRTILLIFVAFERGGLRRHFPLLNTKIHHGITEKSVSEVGEVGDFWTIFARSASYVRGWPQIELSVCLCGKKIIDFCER